MDIDNLLKDFTKIKPEHYEKDIRIFIEYLETTKHAPIIKEILQGVRTKTIADSIDYYIDERGITSVNTVQRYANAIAEFFKYIVTEKHIDNKSIYNEIVLPTVASGSYWGIINEVIAKNKKLKEGDTFQIYTKEEIKKLIKNCDDAIELFKAKQDTKRYYNKFISALCLKLIVYTGVLYRELRKLHINSSLINHDIININGFNIYLPIKLGEQFRYYIKVRENILEKNKKESNYLFITFDGKQFPQQTSIISGFLATCTGRNDLNGIIKYAIREMIVNSISDSVIAKLTGAGEYLLKQCLEDVNKQDSEINWNRYLNSKLLKIDTYDLL